mgnify:CR=1 FL=1
MTKLNLLGAQRVKALTEILERRFKDEINKLGSERISPKEATEELAKQKGKEDLLREVYELEKRSKSIEQEASNELALSIKFDLTYDAFRTSRDARNELNKIQNNGVEEKIEKLKRELEERKSRLWLVETLEEAQEIVNSEIKVN